MCSSTGERRLGEGLSALRTRYIRRAETLLGDQEFLAGVKQARRSWNDRFPRYLIRTVRDLEDGWPVMLLQDLKYYGLDYNPLADPPPKVPEDAFFEVWWAAFVWTTQATAACELFFSGHQVPYDVRQGHPAMPFWFAALAAGDPCNLRKSVAEYFPEFHLRWESPAPTTTLLRAFADPSLAAHVLENLVLRPPVGVTADDLRRDASAIADQRRELAPHQTPWAKVRASIEAGASLPEIARRDGYNLDTLKHAMRKYGRKRGRSPK